MKKLIQLLFLIPAVAAAQQKNPVDSLKQLLSVAKSDTQKVNLLNKIGDRFISAKANEGIIISNQAIALSQKANYILGEADGYYNRGQMFFNVLKSDSARADFEKAIKLYTRANDLRGVAGCYNEIAVSLRVQGKASDAIVYFQKAADMYEKIHDMNGVANSLVYLANNFNQLGEYDKALIKYKKAYEIRVNNNFLNKAAQTLAGIGLTYRNKQLKATDDKNFKLAIQYMFRARDLFIKYDHKLNIALIDKEIGVTYQFQQYYKDALKYLLEAEDRFAKIDYKRELGALYKSIGNCYINLREYPKAKAYYEKGLAAAIAENYQQHVMESYECLYGYYKETGDTKAALKYHEKWMDEKDSLTTRNNFDKVAELTSKYETEKKEQQINLLNKENTIQKLSITKQKTTIGIVAGLSLTLLIFGGLLYNRNKHKQKIELQKQLLTQQENLTQAVIDAEEKERKRIASDLHDGVGQLFSAVKMNLTGLLERVTMNREEDKFLAEKTMALVEESCKEVRVISHQMMPNMLLRSGIASDVKSFIEKIDSERLKVNVEATGFKNKLESNVEIVLYRVIQETVNNVIKHAKATMLDIKLTRDQSGINALIADNGIGFNVSLKDDFAGIGLKNIATRIEYLKGTVDYESAPGKGTRVTIWVPVT